MKLHNAFIAGAVFLGISSCGGPAFRHVAAIPEFKPEDGKALVVLIRPAAEGAHAQSGSINTAAEVYGDTKYVSETEANTVVSFSIDTSEHFIFSRTKGEGVRPMGRVKFRFMAGKTYYIEQEIARDPTAQGPVRIVVLVPKTGEEAKKLLAGKKDLRYGVFNPRKWPGDLDEREFATQQREYSRWAYENPGGAKKEAEYPGY
jgi:hypothetical protein